ncbi:MAG: sortase, partial [Actinomycetota bacterium]
FEPVAPSLRLVDTRPEYGSFGYSSVNLSTIRVAVAGRTVNGITIPSDATAAVFSVVGINLDPGGSFVAAYPSRTALPNTSNLNLQGAGDVANNLVTVKLGTDGAVEFFRLKAGHVVVDLVGVYRPAGGHTREGRFEPLGGLGGNGPAAMRIYSPSTNGIPGDGQVVNVDVQGLIDRGLIEPDAKAVVANLTAAWSAQAGFVSAYPYGEELPETSSLNYLGGAVRAANSFIRIGTDPRTGRKGFHLFVLRSAQIFVDVTGFITGENSKNRTTTGQFVAVTPQRLLDTRSANSAMRGIGGGKRLWKNWTRQFRLPSSIRSQAGAVAVNLTIVEAMAPGFLTLHPALTRRQEVSNVNSFFAGQVAANHAVSTVSTSGLSVFSSHGASVVCDLVGYYKGVGVPTTEQPQPDPPPPAIAPPYNLHIPRVGRVIEVTSGQFSSAVVNTGRAWHWTGTGQVGNNQSPIGTFAHRTDASGPYRNIDWLGPGDTVFIDTADQRRYHYRYLDREWTGKRDEDVLAATFRQPGEILSLIACTVGNDSRKSRWPNPWAPTSLEYRIIVRLQLIGWEDRAPTPF